jgi:arylsulfatase A-like enzyme
MAAALVDEFVLGKDATPDFLGVSFSALDLTGHDFGPRSHEVQDVLIGLDATIGELLSHLDKTVGAANYVVGLTADHGVAPVPEQAVREGLEAGRIALDELAARIEKAIEPFFGPGKYVARMRYTEIYFAPGVYDRLKAEPKALQAVIESIAGTPGIARVFRGEEMAALQSSRDPMARATALSYFAGRSGDILMVPKPYWLLVSTSRDPAAGDATTHGTWYAYDARVPLIMMGPGIQRGDYLEAASPADIAPTLAFLCGITLARADGRVLAEALRQQQATKAAASVKQQ